jgi:hypothetical protein
MSHLTKKRGYTQEWTPLRCDGCWPGFQPLRSVSRAGGETPFGSPAGSARGWRASAVSFADDDALAAKGRGLVDRAAGCNSEARLFQLHGNLSTLR